MEPSSTIHRLDDQDLEARCLAGDPAAAVELFARYRPELVRYCYRHLGNLEDAEDTVQDIAAVLSGSGSPATSVRAWLFRVARNKCINELRRRKDGRIGAGTYFAESQMPSPRTGPRTVADRHERNEELRQQLKNLPPEQSEVLALRYLDGMSRIEIAEILALPRSVVKSRIFHGARALKQRMAKDRGRGE